jgi:murein DD-endopeptidase MepM/ murein hydrolase activator NlpD
MVLALVAFNVYRRGELGTWLRAKFFNQGATVTASAGGGGGAGHALTTIPQSLTDAAAGGVLGATAAGATPAPPRQLSAPVVGPITSPFGQRARDFHQGVDFGVAQGTAVHAAAAGRVISAGAAGGYGLRVDLDHGAGLVTRYAHLSRIDVHNGDDVASGSTIALSGNTGESTGPHLHFEVRVNGVATDPIPWLSIAGLGALAGQQAVTS